MISFASWIWVINCCCQKGTKGIILKGSYLVIMFLARHPELVSGSDVWN
jgi:hypothetical protein